MSATTLHLVIRRWACVWAVAAATLAGAGETHWQCDPPGGGDWFDGDNWTAGVPGAGDQAYVDNGGTAMIFSGSAASAVTRAGHAATGTVIQLGGTHAIDATLELGALEGAEGLYQLTAPATLSAEDEYVGLHGSGTFLQTGGTNDIATDLYLGLHDTGEGTYDLGGAGELSAEAIYVGVCGCGILNARGRALSAGMVFLAIADGSEGTLSLGGGTLSAGMLTCGTGSASFLMTGGTLHAGMVGFALSQDGGTLAPGESIGATQIAGGYSLNAGKVEIELSGSRHDAVDVTGGVHLGGSLKLDWLGAAGEPGSKFGGTYDVITYTDELTGGFTGLAGGIDPAYVAGIEYAHELAKGQFAVRLTLHDQLDGDWDLDGDVDWRDYVTLKRHFGTLAGAEWHHGDADLDGDVDFHDYAALRANFGRIVSGQPPAIPEPATAALLALVSLTVLARRARLRT